MVDNQSNSALSPQCQSDRPPALEPKGHPESQLDIQVVNRALRVLSACTQAVIRSVDENELLQTLCQMITEEAAYRMAWVGYICHDEQKTVQPIAWAGYEAEYLKTANITWGDTERGQGPTGRAVRSRQPIACQNVLQDPSYAPWREAAQQRGYQSSAVLLLMDGDEIFGTLNIYSVEVDAFNPQELGLLTELADSLSYGICTLRARQKQQQAEIALRLSEARFSKAFYGSPVAKFIISMDKKQFLDANYGFEHVFGYTREEVIGKTSLEINMWQDEGDRLHIIRLLQRQGFLKNYEAKFKKRNGEPILCHLSAELIQIGKSLCILAAVEDITDQRAAELKILQLNEALEQRIAERTAALRTNEQRYHALMNQASDAVFIADTNGNLLEANQKAVQLLGYSEDELAHMHASQLHPPEALDRAMQGFRDIQQQKIEYVTDILVRHKGGHCFPVDITGTVIRLGDEAVIWGTFRDITERKQAEAALKRSQEFLRLITDSLPACIIYLDTEQRHRFINKTFEAWFGQPQDDILGKTVQEVIGCQLYEKMREYLDHVFAGESVTYEDYFDQAGLTPRFFQIMALPDWTHDQDQRVQGCFVLILDITSLKQAEQELQRSNEELGQFAYVASHDLQEPLRAITGFTQLLMEEYGDRFDETAQSYADIVIDGAKRMQQLIQDLLAYSRVGTRGKEFTATDCNAVVREAMRNLQVAIAERNATIQVEPLPTLTVDARQLVQVFQNLIGNGIKFCQRDQPHIRISARSQGTDFLFQVEDNGIGIKPQYLDRIFEVFKRLHTRREYPGTGIGLAICKKIVLRHGGQMWAESTLNRGTTFFFTLPK